MPVAHQQMTGQHQNYKDDHSEGAADPESRQEKKEQKWQGAADKHADYVILHSD